MKTLFNYLILIYTETEIPVHHSIAHVDVILAFLFFPCFLIKDSALLCAEEAYDKIFVNQAPQAPAIILQTNSPADPKVNDATRKHEVFPSGVVRTLLFHLWGD